MNENWRKIVPDEARSLDDKMRVVRTKRRPDQWEIDKSNGNGGWEHLLIPPCATMEEAIEKAELVRQVLD